ncbi:MAG: hypothetical protein ACRYFL_00325 [Janthinobacterium lividum]
MENESFDEDLKKHIKQIFEDYDDGHANAGWNLLREKYPAKNDRRYFFWWIAAVLLIVACLVWFFQPETDKPKHLKNIKQVKADSFSKKSITKADSFYANHTKKAVVKTVSDFVLKPKATPRKTVNVISKLTEKKPANKHSNTVFTDVKLDSANHANPTSVSNFVKTDSAQSEKSQKTIQTQNPSIKTLTKKEVVKTASIKKTTQKTARFGLSLFAGSHVNLAKGSNTQLGFGAGISTNFKLNKKLKMSTGLALLQNKLLYQNNVANNNFPAASAVYQTSNSSIPISNNTSLNSLSTSLLQLDIPINLIYNILPGKNSISILAGLSSGTFAKESYHYNYANDAHTSKSFQSIYLLKTLNVAAQFGLPIHKYSLQVEPFVKLPLGNVTTQQLKFEAAGINLKINIQTLKK